MFFAHSIPQRVDDAAFADARITAQHHELPVPLFGLLPKLTKEHHLAVTALERSQLGGLRLLETARRFPLPEHAVQTLACRLAALVAHGLDDEMVARQVERRLADGERHRLGVAHHAAKHARRRADHGRKRRRARRQIRQTQDAAVDGNPDIELTRARACLAKQVAQRVQDFLTRADRMLGVGFAGRSGSRSTPAFGRPPAYPRGHPKT